MICDIHILPVLNPDGVVVGNSTATFQGQKFSKSREGLLFHNYLQSFKKHKVIEYLFLSKSSQDVISLPQGVLSSLLSRNDYFSSHTGSTVKVPVTAKLIGSEIVLVECGRMLFNAVAQSALLFI